MSLAAISCGLLSCADAGDDAGDGAQNVETETPEPNAPEPNAAAEPEPEPEPDAPEPAASAPEPDAPEPTATPEPDAPSPEPQAQPNGTPDAPEPDAPGPSDGGTAGIGGFAAGGSGGVEGVAGAGGTGGSPEVEAISFTRVEQEVFEPAGCTAGYCHGGSAGDLSWSYEELVGPAAAEAVCGLTERVVPGDPEASILWQRVRPLAAEETESCAEMMPKGGPPLDAVQAQLVYDWILGGAAP